MNPARLARALELLRAVNRARAGQGPSPALERDLAELDRTSSPSTAPDVQLDLLSYRPPPFRAAPSVCEECGARRPEAVATAARWLCLRCRTGRLPVSQRNAVEARRRRFAG